MTNKPFSFVLHSGPVIFLGKRERKKKERKRRNKRNKGRNTGEKKAVVERRHRISLVRERLPLSLPPPLLPLLSPRNSEFRIFPPSSSVNLHFSSPLLPTLDAIFLFKSPAMLYNTQYANIHIYICITLEKLGPRIFSMPAHFSLKFWRGNGGEKREGERENKKGDVWENEKMKGRKKRKKRKEEKRNRGEGMTIHLTFSLPVGLM